MIPTLATQEAIRARLLADPVIAQHVEPARIRMASIRSEQLPAIHLSPTQTEILGRASGGQIVAEVRAMVHLWALQDGSGIAEDLAASASVALMDAPPANDFFIDEWDRPHLVWSDQNPAIAHCSQGAISLRAVIRWRE